MSRASLAQPKDPSFLKAAATPMEEQSISDLKGKHGTLVGESVNTIDSEYEWQKSAANLSHIKTSNKKKKEFLVDNRALDEDWMSMLAEKSTRNEPTAVLPWISNDTTFVVKTNSTNPRLQTEKTTLATAVTNAGSTRKRDSVKAGNKETDTTKVLGYWDSILSWLPQVWK